MVMSPGAIAPQKRRQLERQREWYEDARHILVVLSRAQPKLVRENRKFYLVINNGPEYTALSLDGSGNFITLDDMEFQEDE